MSNLPNAKHPNLEEGKAKLISNGREVFAMSYNEQEEGVDERFQWDPDPECLTCFDCLWREECKYVDDAYNTDGDCLNSK
jgi:hypothetical protein